jgi:hypothetical protein
MSICCIFHESQESRSYLKSGQTGKGILTALETTPGFSAPIQILPKIGANLVTVSRPPTEAPEQVLPVF